MAKSRYEITKKLGVGAMGEVWQATDTKLQRKIALKFMTASIEADEEYMKQMTERMHGEARFGAILNHPNIVQIYDFNRWKEDPASPYNNRMYIAMELVEGTTLKSIINNSPRLSIIQSLNTGLQICEALAYAHSQGVFHRDIKPDNIIITKDWTVKLLDFGLAKSINITTTLTKGQIIGTPHYMSPEQTEGKKLDHRTDIFSFGIIMYELLTGERPFPGQTFIEVFNAIRTSTPKPISDLNKRVINSFEKIVNRALEKNPDKRYQETSRIVDDLENEKKAIMLSDAKTIVMDQENEEEQKQQKKSPLKKLSVILPVLVSVIALIIYISFGLNQADDFPVQTKQKQDLPVRTQQQPSLKGPAEAAKVSMIAVKSEADLADAQKLAESSFQAAVQDEQTGNKNFEDSNYEAAINNFKKAEYNFKLAAEEAKENGSTASDEISLLRGKVSRVKQNMLNQKINADKAGGKSMAVDLFNQGLSREKEGSKAFNTATRESYLNAQTAFLDAEKLFKRTTDRAENITIKARTEMDSTKTLVPVFEPGKNTIPAYKQAAEFESKAQINFSQGKFKSARDLFLKAKNYYAAARIDIVTSFKNNAESAQKKMEEVKSKISKSLNEKNKYKLAQKSELAGNQYYSEKDYLKAADQLTAAYNLYSELERESERIILDKQMLEAAHLAIQEKAEKLKGSFLKGSPDELKNVLVFVDDDDKVWEKFFSSIRNIEVDLNIDNLDTISIESNRQEVYFSMKITYLNKTNNSNMDAVMKFSGILQKDGMGGWTLSKLGIMN